MAEYRRGIAYLDYLEDGAKLGNAGFVRTEENDGHSRLELKVKNTSERFCGEYPLLEEGGRELGKISLSRGCGCCCLVWEPCGPNDERIRIPVRQILIPLPGGQQLRACLPEPVNIRIHLPEAAPESPAPENPVPESPAPESPEPEHPAPDTESTVPDADPSAAHPRIVPDPGWETVFPPEMQIDSCERQKNASPALPAPKPAPRACPRRPQPPCRNDKWEQLCSMYPVIHPFGDGREYLSISPGDFVVLRQEYHKMTNNSFLLHGYYNYRHLILGRIREKNGWRFYLGVPGNFYEREKTVAEMFGFEAFEGQKASASPGDFGYFMKRVEI
ncbi:MAG: DUF6128 domain-containing protein [Eubacteriales bacterium]|nr:DUF6128 domain-containing protein [Eubacteriales bacterium]